MISSEAARRSLSSTGGFSRGSRFRPPLDVIDVRERFVTIACTQGQQMQISGRIARTTTGWRAVLTGELSRWPGISFERAVEISASPVLRIQHRVHNRGPTDHLFTLSLSHGQPGPASPGTGLAGPVTADTMADSLACSGIQKSFTSWVR